MASKMLIALTILFWIVSFTGSDEPYHSEVLVQKGVKLLVTKPTYLQPGSNVLVELETILGKDRLKAGFDGNEIPIVSIEKKMFCFAGLDVRKLSGTYRFLLYQQDENGGWRKLFDYPVYFKKLQTKQMLIGKWPRPSKEFTKQYLKERAIIKQALAKSNPAILFKDPFSMPLKEIKMTSECGAQRLYHSPTHISIHSGVDLRALSGTKVYAVNDGKVLLVRKFMLEGNFVILGHGGGIISSYMHLKTAKVKEGDTVRRGDIIGLSGATGNCRGAHLHLGIKVNQQNVDPLQFIEMANKNLFAPSAAHSE